MSSQNKETAIFFGKYSPLSNHHPSPFNFRGNNYATVEQYLAVAKAKIANNQALVDTALSSPNPVDCKMILNSMKDTCTQEWQEQRSTCLMEALRAKFLQNEDLAKYLGETSPLHLGEASRDPVWGIGFRLTDSEAHNTEKWNTEGNLLGKSLMEIREELNRARQTPI